MCKGNNKIVPVDAMMAYGGEVVQHQLLLTSKIDGGSQLQAPAALPQEKKRSVPTTQEAGWTPEPVWTLWGRDLSPLTGIELRFLGRSYRSNAEYAIPSPIMYRYEQNIISHYS